MKTDTEKHRCMQAEQQSIISIYFISDRFSVRPYALAVNWAQLLARSIFYCTSTESRRRFSSHIWNYWINMKHMRDRDYRLLIASKDVRFNTNKMHTIHWKWNGQTKWNWILCEEFRRCMSIKYSVYHMW